MIIMNGRHRLEHKVLVNRREIEELCKWCYDQFGKRFSPVDRETFGRDGTWQCLWKRTHSRESTAYYEFAFDHEKDALLFSLRWL